MSMFAHGDDALIEDEFIPTRPRHRRKLQFVAAVVALAFAVTSAGVTVAVMHHPYRIQMDGTVLDASSWNGTVASALEDNKIEVGEHDVVLPKLETSLTDGMVIQVKHAKPYLLDFEGEMRQVWSTATSVDELLREQSDDTQRASITASRNFLRDLIPLVSHQKTISILAGDHAQNVSVNAGSGVLDVLDTAGIDFEPNNVLQIMHINDGISIELIDQADMMGADMVAFEQDADSEAGSEPTAEVALKSDSQTKVVAQAAPKPIVKTTPKPATKKAAPVTKPEPKPAPKPAPAAKPTTAPAPEAAPKPAAVPKPVAEPKPQPVPVPKPVAEPKPQPAPVPKPDTEPKPKPASSSDSVWDKLAQCESGGNPKLVSRTGKYHGLYQFSVSTWRAVGGSGLPSEASPAEQLHRAKILQARSGWGQWPACSRKIGMR